MVDSTEARVAVYIDFDNVVISRYNELHGRNAFTGDRVRRIDLASEADAGIVQRMTDATVDFSAILDFASGFGTPALTRAYADWSVPVNASYRSQLVARAVDLTQLFPTTSYMKNGADIRLAVDVIEDLFRVPDITHVIIVGGDSDYIPLAQRCQRLGRSVIGIGVSGATSASLAGAYSDFYYYKDLPGIDAPAPRVPAPRVVENETVDEVIPAAVTADPQAEATALLVRAVRVGHGKDDADEWLHASWVKQQLKRIDPTFSERALGFRSFSAFLESRVDVIELREEGLVLRVRLRQ